MFNYGRTMILVVLEAKRSKLNTVASQLPNLVEKLEHGDAVT